MKRILAALLTLTMLLCAGSALAENALAIEGSVECTFKYPLGMELTDYVPDSVPFDPNAYKDYASMYFHDGYVLEGWVQEETGKFFPWTSAAFGGNRALASEGTVFAAREIKGAQITWMALDDSGRMEVLGRQTVYPGDLIQTANGRNAPGQVFKNWKLPDADALLEAGEYFYADRDMTFIAQYEPADTVKLTFKNHEGEVRGVEYVRRGDVFIMKYCGRYGVPDWIPADSAGPEKHFVGWMPEAGGEPIRPGVPYRADGDMVFQAKYSEDGNLSSQTVGFRYQGDERYLSYDPRRGLSPWEVADRFGYPTPEKQLVGIEIDGVQYNALTDVIGFTPEQLEIKNIYEVKLILAPRTAPRRLTVPIANLPETGDPSMLMGWAALLGAAAMGLKRRR